MQNCYTISKFNQYSANSLSLWGDTSKDLIKPTQKENSSWFYTQHLTWDSQKACNVLVHCLYKRLSVSLLNRDKASKLYSPIHQEYCIPLQIMILLWSHLHLFQIHFKVRSCWGVTLTSSLSLVIILNVKSGFSRQWTWGKQAVPHKYYQ